MASEVALTMAWGLLPPVEATMIWAGSIPREVATARPGLR